MNERIKELMEQCRYSEFETEYDMEKFAELIVAECARLAMTQHHNTHPADYDEMDLYDHGRDDTASTISGLIKRTFGVE